MDTGQSEKRLTPDREHYVVENEKLIYYAMNKFFKILPTSIERTDLYQEGMIGLIQAAILYDENSETQFSTYALISIRRKMYEFVANNKFNFHVSKDSYEKIQEFLKLYGTMSIREIAEKLECSETELSYYKRLIGNISMDAEIGDNNDDCIGNYVSDPNAESIYEIVEHSTVVDEIINLVHSKLRANSKPQQMYLYYIDYKKCQYLLYSNRHHQRDYYNYLYLLLMNLSHFHQVDH